MWKSLLSVIFGSILLLPYTAETYFLRDGYNYGPACQWIRIRGKINQEGIDSNQKYFITLYSQSEEQPKPVTLVTNYPINPEYFSLVLAGFEQKLEGVSFIPWIYSFQEEIEFTYFVKSADGKWKSEAKKVIYHPQRIKQDGELICQSDLQIPPVSLIHN